MGYTVNGFEEGTPAWRVFFPALVLGWETIRPVLVRWGLEVPEVLDRRTTVQVVKVLRGPAIDDRRAVAKFRASLKDFSEVESVEALATSWRILATWGARYERRRLAGEATTLAWLQAAEALREFQADLEAHTPNLDPEA